ncbi:FAD-binding protein [Pikeienuella piscinae]|uniref:FAD-binding protein n=1 Tax=Pikeienuella piscinae TaxID=2748098 RepID=A0A7L5BWJ8_9RHOB|nr:FAD-dependent monooxygenase [Pikeienuella piscinae]QIE56265.1 FAD-binding protein [Pikeienuella piscinae]
MKPAPDFDVLIIGGGLAGAAAALAVASTGLEVALFDAAPAQDELEPYDGRAYSVPAGSRRFWEAVGVWERIAGEAQEISDILVSDGRVGEGASPLFLRFDHREPESGGFGRMIEDRHLRTAAFEKLAETPGARIRHGVRVSGSRVEPGRTVATLANGEEVFARLIVAADGRESPLRAAAGIERVNWAYGQNGMVSAVAHERPHHGVAHELFLPAGPFAILPLKRNRSSLVWTESAAEAARIHALPDDLYLAELETRFGDFLGALSLEGKRWTYPLHFSLAHEYVAPRLALLGDAAHAVHPIAGQGLNLGVRDAAALAEVLAGAMRRGEDIGDIAVLRRYEQWRRFDSAALGLSMDALNRLFSNDIGPLRALRDLGLGMVNNTPGLRRAFMRAASGLSGEVPKLMRGEAI